MKAYQIKIEIIDSKPLIWRRVIMPAGATFNRLHDVIQTVTNFKSGYPYEANHLFAFDLTKDNIRVTNDEEAYEEHKYFIKNRKIMEERMQRDASTKFVEFQEARLENLKTIIRKPVGLKIDTYIERDGEVKYTYDFGDNWQFIITLERILDNYKYGYPSLIDGAETAPPEDVGGLDGYKEFLHVYFNHNHPEHQEVKKWASNQNYKEYDEFFINQMLKFIKYKKNE